MTLLPFTKRIQIGLIAFILLALAACTGISTQDKEAKRRATADSLMQVNIGQLLQQQFLPDSLAKWFKPKNISHVQQALKTAYQTSDNKPLWIDPSAGQPLPAAAAYIQELQNAPNHALNSQTYLLQPLLQQQQILAGAAANAPYDTLLSSKAQYDVLLTASALAYAADLNNGYLTPAKNWDLPAKTPPAAAALTAALSAGQINQFITAAAPAYEGYQKLQQQYAQYRQAAQDNPKAKAPDYNLTNQELAQKIAINMERYRWLPHPDSVSPRRVWVNIPEFKMHVFDNNKEIDQIVVVVGEPKHATPIIVNKPMTNVVFSPTWTIPPSIGWEEMEYIIMNPAVLITADVDVFIDGKKTDPREVDWSTIEKRRVKMRQRPKTTNSMGLVKFPFANNFGIYIHDTPNKVDFGGAYRAQSHGCVRVQEPKKLAQLMLNGSKWTEGSIGSAMYSGKEQFAKLPQPVSVTIFYLTTWVDDNGKLQFGRDVYGHDKRQIAQL
ncbi:MAG TPA: L,D-transpeptidase family protein [Chitinophagales bacterium]|nr:L,D-transpeptidase family protein [Chitinophagales bacterium]HRK28510.1 L,D-transpeptidase family protein [Chitinophagales bacterium]